MCISIVDTHPGALHTDVGSTLGKQPRDQDSKAFAAQVRLSEDTDVDVSIDGDTIVIAPVAREWKLDDLVRKITPDNRHSEVEIGSTSGKEAW